MSDLTVKKIIEICSGILYCGSEDVVCTSYNKDTRIIKENDTYIGIKGENFDGNSLYKEAFSKGANCCILENDYLNKEKIEKLDKPIILVDNSKEALRKIASYIRENSDAIFIGVTGSVGKTSTRDMIYSVVKKQYKSLKTEGNYNNDIGLPLTIMRIKDENCAVIEMGMNNLGEIEYLSNITRPNISVITNVGTAHIGNLGSRENILKAKLEIKSGMDEKGILIINNDNDLLHEYYLKNKENVLTVGISNESDVMAYDINYTSTSSSFKIKYKNNTYDCNCPVNGEAYIYNSLVAFAVGMLTNVDIEKILDGISDFKLTENRLELIKTKNGINILNDCYNASVDSMKSSLEILKNSVGKRKIAVLGDMLELGEFSEKLHKEVGKFVVNNNVDLLITVGEYAKYIAEGAKESKMNEESIFSFDTKEEAIEYLNKILEESDIVLIKASHGMKLDLIVNSLLNNYDK
ncbi:MAG: UDP-N-acetylmuramoyl-tripeptide--D-alanyl-D-alanine ligase [Firmicutes bacterium]|nr:UDP-N-acetylmuramoyl-tripeptide--D-alanyl-D-alanine ligase [Bacillota bacterium]